MEIVVAPEPDEGEREALLDALREALRGLDRHPGRSVYASAWRRAALDLDDD